MHFLVIVSKTSTLHHQFIQVFRRQQNGSTTINVLDSINLATADIITFCNEQPCYYFEDCYVIITLNLVDGGLLMIRIGQSYFKTRIHIGHYNRCENKI